MATNFHSTAVILAFSLKPAVRSRQPSFFFLFFSLKPADQEQAAELIANYLLKRGIRERLVEGGVFRALCHLAESANIKVCLVGRGVGWGFMAGVWRC